jgi:hypothetical protein
VAVKLCLRVDSPPDGVEVRTLAETTGRQKHGVKNSVRKSKKSWLLVTPSKLKSA